MRMNGSLGMSGMIARAIAATPAICSAERLCVSCFEAAVPMSLSAVERVTMRPVDTDISSAGICVTRPSPMVSMLKR